MQNADREAERLLHDLRRLSVRMIKKKHYHTALSSMIAFSNLAYYYNQFYTDAVIEKCAADFEQTLSKTKIKRQDCVENVVVFYDGIGLDTRGLVLIYLQALLNLGYYVVYITTKEGKKRQVEVKRLLSAHAGNSKAKYLSSDANSISGIKELSGLIERIKPSHAFFYAYPFDVGGEIVFAHYKNVVFRYQINLTDHAFWIGMNAFDYCIEFREYGASISHYYRGIDKSRLVLLPFYPWKDEKVPFQGFPFRVHEKTKILFSGGSLYKTINKEMTYYYMVDGILKGCPDVIFLYASGEGDDRGIRSLSERYLGRVYHISERKDLYQLMRHVDIYLSTYPMAGGLMYQYAAMAGIPPFTLVRDGEVGNLGFLIDEEHLGIFHKTADEVIEEICKCLSDQEYYKSKCDKITGSVITPDEFQEQLQKIMQHQTSKYKYDLKKVDTVRFRADYKFRMSHLICENAIASKNTCFLFPFYVFYFLRKIKKKIKEKVSNASN